MAESTPIRQALLELRLLTTCTCEGSYRKLDRHMPGCNWELREDVDVLTTFVKEAEKNQAIVDAVRKRYEKARRYNEPSIGMFAIGEALDADVIDELKVTLERMESLVPYGPDITAASIRERSESGDGHPS